MTARGQRPVVGIFGTFDVENYGDLLFPLIARRQLRGVARVVPVSPTDAGTCFTDAPPPLTVDAFARGKAPSAVLIGGGNIVHMRDFGLDAYKAVPGQLAYPALWMGATMIGAAHRCPVIWNVPGVLPLGTGDGLRALLAATLDGAALLAVRDTASAGILAPFTDRKPDVVPDTALNLDMVWPRQRLARRLRELLTANGISPTRPTLAVHVKERSLGDMTVDVFAARLSALARTLGLLPVLVAIGRVHSDGKLARAISAQLTVRHVTLDAPQTLEQVAAVIACSRAAAVASLHGFITATAYGTPAALVAVPALAKFRGFAAQVERADDVVADWPGAIARLEALGQAGWPAPAAPDAARAALVRHWDRVRALIAPAEAAATAPAPRLLDEVARAAIARDGVTSLLAAALPKD